MSLNQTNVLDVVIVGGGLVGGLTALLLAQGGVQATVLDAAPILDVEKTLKYCESSGFGAQVKPPFIYSRLWAFGKNLHVSSLIQVCRCGIKMAMVKLILVMLAESNAISLSKL